MLMLTWQPLHDDGARLQDRLLDVLVGQYDGAVEVHLVLRGAACKSEEAQLSTAKRAAPGGREGGAWPMAGRLVRLVQGPPTLMNTSSPITALFSMRAQLPTARCTAGGREMGWPSGQALPPPHTSRLVPAGNDQQHALHSLLLLQPMMESATRA